MEYKIIDNALSQKDFLNLKNTLIGTELDFPWYYSPYVSAEETSNNCYYFIHTFYDQFQRNSNFFYLIKSLLNIVNPKALIRAKANFYPSNQKLESHGFHIDQPYPHRGLVFYVNTNDGYTELEDGTRFESVENRILLFDSSKSHQSTNCTNVHGRVTVNINYF